MSNNDTGKKVATGAVIAGLIGFIAGILTAPKSGKETRQDIKNAGLKARKEAEKKLKQLHSELNSLLDDAKKKGNKLSGKAKAEFDKNLDKATEVKEKIRELLSALHEGDADDPELKKALKDAKEAISHLKKYVKG